MWEWVRRLDQAPRILMEACLRPLQGDRIQPAGFPDLGPARYRLHDGTEMLLVESNQSVANRMEQVCWDGNQNDLVEGLRGLPFVRIELGEMGQTCSLLEFHRLNSPYLWGGTLNASGQEFIARLRHEAGIPEARKKGRKSKKASGPDASEEGKKNTAGVLDMQRLAKTVFRYDPNSVIHGVFLERLAGRCRLTRALTGFIEARDVEVAESGGVKLDRVNPKGDARLGYGHVPFHRSEFTAGSIVAYFNLDLALLRGYGLGEDAVDLLVALSMFKVTRFLDAGLRLRSACDLEVGGEVKITRPTGLKMPREEDLMKWIRKGILDCGKKGLLADPAVTTVGWDAR